jgi:hypothetical protein
VDRIYYGFLLVSSDMSKTYLLFGSLCLEFLPNSSFCTRDEFNKIEKILGGGAFCGRCDHQLEGAAEARVWSREPDMVSCLGGTGDW